MLQTTEANDNEIFVIKEEKEFEEDNVNQGNHVELLILPTYPDE